MSVEDVLVWIEGGAQGTAPATILGGVQDLPPGEAVFLRIDLESGIEYTAVDPSNNVMESFTPS
jgi:hypothetical protein